MRRFLAFILLLCAAPAYGAIASDGSCIATANNCTLSGTSTNALLVFIAVRSASLTAPSLPASNTNVTTQATASGGTIASLRVYCRVASSGADTGSGTATNATSIYGVSLSGANVGTTANCPITANLTNFSFSSAKTSTTASFGGLTLADATTSWVVSSLYGSASSLCTPSNLTARQTGAGVQRGLDTNSAVSSFSTSTCSVSSETWMTIDLEVLAANCATPSGLIVQCKGCTGNGTSLACAYTSNVAATHLLVAVTGTGPGSGPLIVTDGSGNTWANATTNTTNGAMRIDYVKSSAASATTITAHVTSGDDIHLAIYEISGTDLTTPLDQVGSGNGTASDQTVALSMNSTANNEVLIAAFYDNATGSSYSPGTGYADPVRMPVLGADTMFSESSQSNTAGAQTAHATRNTGSAAYGGIIAGFKQAAAPGGTIYHRLPLLGVGD